MSGSTRYGLRVHPYAVCLKMDRGARGRVDRPDSMRPLATRDRKARRGRIHRWSKASARRLRLIALNAGAEFRSLVTLTYRARTEDWESDRERNLRIVQHSKADLHRFLRCLRKYLGDYLWVQEFQKRGVVHYHILCTALVDRARIAEVWARASGQIGDDAVLRIGADVKEVESQRGVRDYAAAYIGKEKQKSLPAGVEGAGRWWGRSRSLEVVVLDELTWLDTHENVIWKLPERIGRIMRKYLSKVFRYKYRGGVMFDFKGERLAKVPEMIRQLREHYGDLAGVGDMVGRV